MRSAIAFAVLAVAVVTAEAETRFGSVLTHQFANSSQPNNAVANADVTLDDTHTEVTFDITVRGLSDPIVAVELLAETRPVVRFIPFVSGPRIHATVPIDKLHGDRMVTNIADFQLVIVTESPSATLLGTLTRLDFVPLLAGVLRGPTPAIAAFAVTLDHENRLTAEIHTAALPGPTLAHIHDAATGELVVELATAPALFDDGRMARTVGITDETRQALTATPEAFYVDVHTPSGIFRGPLAPAREYEIAAAGKIGTWVTDVRIFNPSFDESVVALVEFFSGALSANFHPAASLTVQIPRRGTAILDDIAGRMGVTGTGALRITSTSPLIATSRIYNGGRLGQFVPAMARESIVRRGVMPQLAYRVQKARTNLGIFNPNPVAVSVRLAAHISSGGPIVSRSFIVGPRSHRQSSIVDFFFTEAINNDDLTVTYDASAPLIVYASVVDAVSSDPIFVPPQPDPEK